MRALKVLAVIPLWILLTADASPAPTDNPSPQPTPSPTPSLIAIPAGSNNNGLDVMLRPPFIFLPIFGLIALFLAIGYWLFSKLPRPQRNLPSASIVHRSARPLRGPIYPNATPPPPGDEPPTEPPWAGPREG